MASLTTGTAIAEALAIFVIIVSAPLGAALVAGLVIGILQAATQIQDQTLPALVKIAAVIGVFAALSGALIHPLVRYSEKIFADFPAMVP